MTRHVENLELRRPAGPMLIGLYRLLGDIFEPDRSLMQRVIDGSVRLRNWDHFVLCRGEEIVSHAALVRMSVWFEGRLVPVAGIASVFTLPAHRRMGLARRLLEHALAIADAAREPCILFTSLPHVYESLGFDVIRQHCHRADARALSLNPHRFEMIETRQLGTAELQEMERIYTQVYPDYDGKLLREPDYWPFYQAVFNGRSVACAHAERQDVCLAFCTAHGRPLGYVRTERENQAIMVTEVCAPADAVDVTRALLAQAFNRARSEDADRIVLALPALHPAWAVLAGARVETVSDEATSREVFMARLTPDCEFLRGLQWSLADKF